MRVKEYGWGLECAEQAGDEASLWILLSRHSISRLAKSLLRMIALVKFDCSNVRRFKADFRFLRGFAPLRCPWEAPGMFTTSYIDAVLIPS